MTSPSDRRIKNIIGVSDSARDLTSLEKIHITDYTMKDPGVAGNTVIKKVIAQEVEAILPSAVTASEGALPDIMQLSKVSDKGNGLAEIALAKNTDLKAGEKIQIISSEELRKVGIVKEIEDGKLTIAIDGMKDGEEVLVYGRFVNDLRAVDYDAISMLNVSATQELAKRTERQQKEIDSLKAENAKLNAALAKMEALEKAVAALEGKSNETVTVSLVK